MIAPYYDSDGITIYHGDARELLPDMPTVDLICTDPPYGIGFAAQPTTGQRRAGMRPVSWDDVTVPDLLPELSVKAPKVIIWGGNYYWLSPARCWLSWYKPDAPPSMGQFELAWTNLDQPSRLISHSIAATNAERVGFPTQKPLRVMRWCLGLAKLDSNSLILDAFAGSGSTLRAAKECGHRAIGIEIDEAYCELAAKRLSQGVLNFQELEEATV